MINNFSFTILEIAQTPDTRHQFTGIRVAMIYNKIKNH